MIKVLYIVGSQRGGTTLPGRVLGEIAGIAFGGEVRRIWERGLGPGRTCGCGELLEHCPLWGQVLPVALGGYAWQDVQRWQQAVAPTRHTSVSLVTRPFARTRNATDASRYREVMGRLYTAIAEFHGAGVVVDASKSL